MSSVLSEAESERYCFNSMMMLRILILLYWIACIARGLYYKEFNPVRYNSVLLRKVRTDGVKE